MSTRADHWSVATAKAHLSEVLAEAQRRPQVIERRGLPVAIVVAVNEFEDRREGHRWQAFLEASAQLRAQGGAELRIPRRTRRPSPFRRP